jgi:hypothetical protein
LKKLSRISGTNPTNKKAMSSLVRREELMNQRSLPIIVLEGPSCDDSIDGRDSELFILFP